MSLASWLRKTTTKPAPAACFRPRLEDLDGRCLPSLFTAPTDYPTQGRADAVAAADLNGDGRLDLVTADQIYGGVSVLLGKARGQFALAGSYPPGIGSWSPSAVAVGDVTGDGKPDIVTVSGTADGQTWGSWGGVSVFAGNGNGTFQPAQNAYLLADTVADVALGDVNGDGRLDIVAVGNGVAVLINSGGGVGTWATQSVYADPVAGAVALADLNGDGRPDIATVGNGDLGSRAGVLLNNGDGTFGAVGYYDAGPGYGADVAVADVNGDGRPDVVTANGNGNTIGVLLGGGDGTFGAARTFVTGGTAISLAVADFNRDGRPDVAVTGGELDVLLGSGDGAFGTALYVAPGGSSGVVAGDFNGDGYPDLAQTTGDGVEGLLNQGNWSGNKHK